MKRLLAWLLSLMMLLTPLVAPAEVLSAPAPLTTERVVTLLFDELGKIFAGEKPGLDITFTTPDGEITSAGLGLTDTGVSAHFDAEGTRVQVTESAAFLSDETGTIGVSLEDMLAAFQTIAASTQKVPNLTEAEIAAIKAFAQELVLSMMGCGGITYNMSGNMLNLHVDLDQILTYVDTLLPTLLSKHAAQLDSVLAKYTPFIFDEVINCEQLSQLWSSIGLGSLNTGLVLDVMVFQRGNTLTLMASCLGWDFQASLSDMNFACSATSPEGIVYKLDMMDVLTAVSIFASVPDAITDEAIKFEQLKGETEPTFTTAL